jgi:hypothetical protein
VDTLAFLKAQGRPWERSVRGRSDEHEGILGYAKGAVTMKGKTMLICAGIAVVFAGLAARAAISGEDKYTVKVPGGLAFSEFRGYESWQTIAVSHNGEKLAVILGNPAMIAASRPAIPAR